jgi:CheY-like chemotaxis protein
MSKGKVVLIDDQPLLVQQYYAKALEIRGYDVVILESAAAAWDYFVVEDPEVCAVVLDIIMPPPPQIETEDHRAGTRTGVFLYKHILRLFALQNTPKGRVPIAVLTQSNDKEMFDILLEVHKAGRPLEQFQMWSKSGLDPGDFASEFEEWLQAVRELYKS